ncbi:MAG: hypothetical protein ACI4J0_02300 [Huintestinicola sp.]|uniref:hypothetical protein n=1 Tax=Huintestinicola sp. TaxID=2981661 RepID=UPI003F0D9F5D
MKKKLDLSTFMAAIHLTVVLSAVCFGTIYLSLSILTIPALTAAFVIGKDVIYKQFDVHDGLLKRFFKELRASLGMMKYFPLQLLVLLQTAGMYGAEKTGLTYLSYPMLICISFVCALIVYVISFHVFYMPKPAVTTVIIAMMYRVHYFIIVWLLTLLVTVLFGIKLMGIFLIAGAVLILGTEVCAFLGIMGYKKLRKELTDEEKNFFGEEMLKKL